MPPWIPRLILLVFLAGLGFILALGIVRVLRGFLVLLLVSFFLSTALEPGVAYLAKRGWRRGAATGVLFLLVFVVGGTFLAMMVPLIVDQTAKLIDRAPGYLDQISEWLSTIGIEFSGDRLGEAFTTLEGDVEGFATDIAGRVFGVGTALLNSVFQLLTIALFTFYLTADGPRLRRTLLSVLRPDAQREMIRILDIAVEKTGGYFYSRTLLAGLASLVTWAVLSVIGVPFALPLGVWVGTLSQFVPVVGTYLGGVLPVLIALLESPGKAIAVIVFIVLYQQVENYLIGPRVTAQTMSLHPAIAFGSAIVGASLLGAPGALMALPAAATLQAVVSTYIERHQVIAEPPPLEAPEPVEPA
ncbi:MAG: AI-2E family transporter [Acidimicrobiia bacterium]|nr:AI-2E family transporter [Acidimicrobiia bacterium]